MKQKTHIFFAIITCSVFLQSTFANASNNEEDVIGMSILSRLPGLWNGPVYSSTPAGSFPMWYVDLRPVSPGQISFYSSLDAETINYLTFFIVRHDNKLKVAIRTEGVFQNKGCVTYEVIDSVNENLGYYRFSDFQSGVNRAYTEFRFTDESHFVMEVYTNKFNMVKPLELHSRWEAKCFDKTAAQQAVSHFNFPQSIMVKDFSEVFAGMHETIYYTFENDPYSSTKQPYIGSLSIQVNIDKKIKVSSKDELFIMLTAESIFDNGLYISDKLQYLSRFVYLPYNTRNYTFNNLHPGTYYMYAYIDTNGDKKHTKGEYMSSGTGKIVRILPESKGFEDIDIDIKIP